MEGFNVRTAMASNAGNLIFGDASLASESGLNRLQLILSAADVLEVSQFNGGQAGMFRAEIADAALMCFENGVPRCGSGKKQRIDLQWRVELSGHFSIAHTDEGTIRK